MIAIAHTGLTWCVLLTSVIVLCAAILCKLKRLYPAQMPNMANLGLNAASQALPYGSVPGGMQPGNFVSGGSYHSAHGMQMQPPAQMTLSQAYAAQVRTSNSASWIRAGNAACRLYISLLSQMRARAG